MKKSSLSRHYLLWFAFTFVLTSFALGQQRTWFVNNQIGSDSFDGWSSVVGVHPSGPKRTIASALAAAQSGDSVVIAATNSPYGTASGEPPTVLISEKKLTWKSTGGSVIVSSTLELGLGSGALPAEDRVLIFSGGRFELMGGLKLTRGNVIGARNLILGGTITRLAYPMAAEIPTLDAPPAGYGPFVDVEYDGTSPLARIAVGHELGGPGIDTTLRDFRVGASAALEVALTRSPSLKGRFALSSQSTIDLNGHTLTLVNSTPITHVVSGSVRNGWLLFSLGESVFVNGNGQLPNIIATAEVSQTLFLNNFFGSEYAVQSIRSQREASVVLQNAAMIGAPGQSTDVIINSGAGDIILDDARTVNGNVVLNTPSIAVPPSSRNGARILFNSPDPLTINGDVILDAAILVSNEDLSQADGIFAPGFSKDSQKGWGVISFPDQNVTIKGKVINSVVVGGSLGAETRASNHGQIRFYKSVGSRTSTTIMGSVSILASTPLSFSDDSAVLSGMGSVVFGNDRGDVRIDGGIINAGSWFGLNGKNLVNNGRVVLLNLTTGRLGTTINRIGPINQSSVAVEGSGNGDLLLGGATSVGDFQGTTITVSGERPGGIIRLSNGSVRATNVTNARSAAGTHLFFGYDGGDTGMKITLSGLSSKGSSATLFSHQLDSLTISGVVELSGSGRIGFARVGDGAMLNFGSLSMKGGLLDLSASNFPAGIVVGNVELLGGTIDFREAPWSFIVRGRTNFIGSTSTGPHFLKGTRTTLIFEAPVPATRQDIVVSQGEVIWPGSFHVNSTAALTDAVRFAGGNLRVLGTLAFLQPASPYGILLDETKIFVAGSEFVHLVTYSGRNGGAVVMNGTVQEVRGEGSFGDLEINSSGIVTVADNTGPITSRLILSRGVVYNAGSTPTGSASNVLLSNRSVPPTVVIDEGGFASGEGPTFGSGVNVTYIGGDKLTSTELPLSPSTLVNLTIGTTTGRNQGKGVVTFTASVTVNGKLSVNKDQTLMIGPGNFLKLQGDSAVIEGSIANEGQADPATPANLLLLAHPNGTTITGSGILCDILVGVGSLGNTLNGPKGVINRLLGPDGSHGGGDDFDNTVSEANGTIYLGDGTASLTAAFGTAYGLNGTHFKDLRTTNSGNSFTLGANVGASGNLTHGAGNMNLGTFTYTHRGTGPSITGGATITGTGTLQFTAPGATLTVNSSAATIAANVDISLPLAGDIFTAPAGQNLTLSGNLSVTSGTLMLSAGRTLTLTGTTFAIGPGGSVTGTGTLHLNAATPPLTWSYSGTLTITNVQISNDVLLSGSGTSLTISGTFTHDGGNLNVGSKTLTLSGTYSRSGIASYTATTGYLEFSGTTFDQGSTNVSTPNLRLKNSADVAMAGTGVVTVTGNLDAQVAATRTFTITVSNAVKFAVADGATVIQSAAGDLDASPAYAGTMKFTSKVDGNISTKLWPNSASLVTTFTVDPGAGKTSTQTSSRQVNTALTLTSGTLALGATTLTIADHSTVNAHGGNVSVTTGSVAYGGTDVSLSYAGTTATGPELPPGQTVKDLTFTRSTNSVNFTTTLNKAVTVSGTLAIRNNLASTTAGAMTVLGNVTVASEAATFPSATAPVITLDPATLLTFSGSANQTFTIPSTGATVSRVSINKTNATNTVTIAGGNLTVTRTLFFVNGVMVTDSNSIVLEPNGTFDRAGVTATLGNVSHIAGNVRANVKNGVRVEFPVGTTTLYRPLAITVVSGLPVGGVNLTVNHVVTTSTFGSLGLPMKDGIRPGIDVAWYPLFYWFALPDQPVSSAAVYHLELTAAGFTDFDPNDLNIVGIIWRGGTAQDVNNAWVNQGGQTDNITIGGVLTARRLNAVGGLISSGAIFTYGLKSNMVIANPFTIPTLTDAAPTFRRYLRTPALITGNTGALSFTASAANTAIVDVSISNDTLIVTRKVSGTTTVSITATDAFDGSRITYTTSTTVITVVETLAGNIPTEFALEQNYPNPFNPSTTIRFALPKEAPVTLVIYNVLGVPVRTLLSSENLNAAHHQITWDGKDDASVTLPSGVYLYRISAGTFQTAKKMTLLR